MIIINDFFVRKKEAVSNQMELLLKYEKGVIISAKRFMGQKSLQEVDIKDSIYIYNSVVYVFIAIYKILKNKKDIVHIFEEEPCWWKRLFCNIAKSKVYVSMYRRPNEKYAKHLKKYKGLECVFVELDCHRNILISNDIPNTKVITTLTPPKIEREYSDKNFDLNNIKILFASWNSKEGDYIEDRGLKFLLEMLNENKNMSLTIPIRDNNTKLFEEVAMKMGVFDRIKLLNINTEKELVDLFDETDFVAFIPQKRVVKDVPNSLIDGLVRGKPVIISTEIDFSSVVNNNKIGIIVESGKKGFKLELTKKQYENMSKRAYEYSNNHNKDMYVDKIIKEYRK